jgi:hypothetical protein
VTSAASLPVVHGRPESQKVVRPGGSQRGSQWLRAWPTGSPAVDRPLIRRSGLPVGVIRSKRGWLLSCVGGGGWLPTLLSLLLSAQPRSSGGKPTRTAGPPGPRTGSGAAELRITRVFSCVARGFKARLSFMFAGCCRWRSLAVDGSSGTSRGTRFSTRLALSPVAEINPYIFRIMGCGPPDRARWRPAHAPTVLDTSSIKMISL